DQIKQVLLWLRDDPDLRARFLADPEAVIQQWAVAGHVLSDDAKRQLLRAIEKSGFDGAYDRYWGGGVVKGSQEALTIAPPSRPVDQEEMAAANGKAPQQIVNTGFVEADEPETLVDGAEPLAAAADYYFIFEVGEKLAGSIEAEDVELPTEELPPEALLSVALFTFKSEIELTPGQDVGEIRLQPDGTVRVVSPAAQPAVAADLLARRLFFPVKTPASPGRHRLRCNVYYRQTLVQSRLVTVHVAQAPADGPALVSEVDYTLSHKLDGRQLTQMGKTRLSLMLNDNGNGTHGFRFFGEKQFKNDAELGEGELQDLIQMARGGLRKAAWGEERPYQPGDAYRYQDGDFDEARFKEDVVRLALRGYRFYDTLINRLAGDADKAWDLADLMLKPGQVQIASKKSARLVIPAALFYDYPLDDGLKTSKYELCSDFMAAIQNGSDLTKTACLQGECPTYDDDKTICPSGFWGYRHSLGLPVTVAEEDDAAVAIASPDTPGMAVSVSTDPNFRARPNHEKRLKKMELGWEYADDRDETLDMLKQTEAQVVYFYCHGGVKDNLPYLSVGPVGGSRITRGNLRAKRIRWGAVRPLVFINGCHTTALEPEMALDLVSGFVEVSRAAGVVGTEITIFEPIAVTFAEECLRRFLVERDSIGEAIRAARLKMLQAGNPLGLVYIPYVMAGLKLNPGRVDKVP
ncbi:MAG: hypothetical protein ACE5EY_09605, partial [Anaerolineae bacterium]